MQGTKWGDWSHLFTAHSSGQGRGRKPSFFLQPLRLRRISFVGSQQSSFHENLSNEQCVEKHLFKASGSKLVWVALSEMLSW